MPLDIVIRVCGLGSMSVEVLGDTRLAKTHRDEIIRTVEEQLDRAALASEAHEHLDQSIGGAA